MKQIIWEGLSLPAQCSALSGPTQLQFPNLFSQKYTSLFPFKQLKKLGVTCKLWKINPLTLKPRKIIMRKHHDLAYGIFIGTLLHDNQYHDDVWYDLDPLLLGTPQNKLAASPSTPKRSSLWLPGRKILWNLIKQGFITMWFHPYPIYTYFRSSKQDQALEEEKGKSQHNYLL